MSTITITILRASVLSDMKVKAHAEAASVADAKQRYLLELGTEKEEEANQCINDAAVEVEALLRPLGAVMAIGSDNTYDTTANIVFTFDVTARKASGLQVALIKAVHAFMVDSALEKYYISVSRAENAERHSKKLASEIAAIERLAYTKQAPSY